MYQPAFTIIAVFPYLPPVIDEEFDSFDLNYELESDLRETESANFYHGAIDPMD